VKPLVCVAPDGSLEVWRFVDDDLSVANHFSMWNGHAEFRMGPGDGYGPEFWGREVLGEL
jgi:hypothetical protein